MSETAHRTDAILHASFDLTFASAGWFPPLERDNPTNAIQTEAGDDITLDGQQITAISLQAYKTGRNTFIAIGGPN